MPRTERVCDLCQGAGERFGVKCGKCGGSGVLLGGHKPPQEATIGAQWRCPECNVRYMYCGRDKGWRWMGG